MLIGSSCAPQPAASGGSAITIRNESGEIIRETRVEAPGFSSVGGTVYPGTKARHFSPRGTPAGAAELVWRDASGASHREKVSIDGAAARGGDVEFAVRGDDPVKVRGAGRD